MLIFASLETEMTRLFSLDSQEMPPPSITTLQFPETGNSENEGSRRIKQGANERSDRQKLRMRQ